LWHPLCWSPNAESLRSAFACARALPGEVNNQ
jgi:hypothetical protein